MSRMDPVDFDIRLHRQRIRRQALTLEDIKKHKKSLEDSSANVAPVNLADDEDLLAGTFSPSY